jgi:hypothetical protein
MPIFLASLIIVIQVATGSLIILRTPFGIARSKFEVVGLGLALGTFLSLISASLFATTTVASISWAFPSILVFVYSLITYRSVLNLARGLLLPRSEVVAVLIGLGIGLALLLINWIRTPLSSIRAGGSVDMYFFEALSRGVSQFGPIESILMSGGSLRYHWFTYGWAGQLSNAADLESFVALTRILPVVALVGVTLLAASWARSIRIGNSPSPAWVPTLAVLLIVFAGYTGALYGGILNFDSPSQFFTTIWMLALVITFMRGLTCSGISQVSVYLLLVFTFTAATTGGKASHAIAALGGFGLIAFIGLVIKTSWRSQALLLLGAAVTGFAVTFLIVLSGVGIEQNLADAVMVRASTWQGLDPVAGRWGPLLGTQALLLAVLARMSGTFWLATNHAARRSPEFLFAVGAIAIGALALLALRGGINELWFFLAASAPVAVISAYGIGQAQSWLSSHGWNRRGIAISLLIAALASGISLILSRNWVFDSEPNDFFQWPGLLFWSAIVSVWVLTPLLAILTWRLTRNFTGNHVTSSARWVLAVSVSALVFTSILTRPAVLWTESRTLITDFGLVQSVPNPIEESGEQLASLAQSDEMPARFSAADWLVANSNIEDIVITNRPDTAFIPAFTGNRMYLAGQQYQFGLGPVSQHGEIERRAELSRSLSTGDGAEMAQALCQEGISLVWIEGGNEQAGLTPIFSTGDISLFDLREICSK